MLHIFLLLCCATIFYTAYFVSKKESHLNNDFIKTTVREREIIENLSTIMKHLEWVNKGIAKAKKVLLNIETDTKGINTTDNNTLTELKQPEMQVLPEMEILRDFGLYLRMYHKMRHYYETMLVPSMKQFWFLPVNLTVVLDDTPEDRTFGQEISQKYPYPIICHQPVINAKYYHGTGFGLMQLSMLLADTCFNKKYVGFVDSDTFFTTPVTPELLFDKTKPIVIGQYGNLMTNWPKATKLFLLRNEVFRCMSYFPVVMKVEHIIEMRDYIAKVHNRFFLTIFSRFSKSAVAYSQFNLMCNYVWYFHKEEYQFFAQFRRAYRLPRNHSVYTARESDNYYDKHLTEAMKFPFPRSSIHFKYHRGGVFPYIEGVSEKQVPRIIKEGQCYSGGFMWCPEACWGLIESSLHKALFMFEDSDWTWDEKCLESQRRHYLNVETNYKEEVKKKVLEWCQEQTKD